MPITYDTSHTVEFYRTWQHPLGPIFNIGDKCGVSKAMAEEIEQKGLGKIVYRGEEKKKDVKAPAKNKQVESASTK